MEIIDISRELFTSQVYPGDPEPYRDPIRRMSMGDVCNLSGFYACCHTATHIDAPSHFFEDGSTIESMDLSKCMGRCTVVEVKGIITGADIDEFLPRCEERILFKGNGEAFLSQSAAFVLADAGIRLVGTDATSIELGEEEEYPAHRLLLGEEIPILEGLNLTKVQPGSYRLIAFPLLLGGAEAAPVRAVLLKD